jgi:hypothetical protein
MPAVDRAAAKATARIFDHRPNLGALQSKLESFLSSSSASSVEARDIFVQDLVPFLRTASPLQEVSADELARKILLATRSASGSLPPSQHFPFLDLLRLALLDEHLGAALNRQARDLAEILLQTPFPEELQGTRATLLVTLKLLANVFASTASSSLATALIDKRASREALLRIVVQGLLFGDGQDSAAVPVREAAAALALALTHWVSARRDKFIAQDEDEDGGAEGYEEEWEAELTSALLEALAREKKHVELGYRLLASLGLVLRFSPHYAALAPLAMTLDSEATLQEKKTTLFRESESKEDNKEERELKVEARKLIDEVSCLLSIDS